MSNHKIQFKEKQQIYEKTRIKKSTKIIFQSAQKSAFQNPQKYYTFEIREMESRKSANQ